MAERKVEVVRRCYEAYRARDLDALLSHLDADVAWLPTVGPAGPPRSYRGHDGVRAYFAYLAENWPSWQPRVESVRDLGDSLLILGSIEGRDVRGDGLTFMASWVWRFHRERVVSMRGYPHMGDALAAVAEAATASS